MNPWKLPTLQKYSDNTPLFICFQIQNIKFESTNDILCSFKWRETDTSMFQMTGSKMYTPGDYGNQIPLAKGQLWGYMRHIMSNDSIHCLWHWRSIQEQRLLLVIWYTSCWSLAALMVIPLEALYILKLSLPVMDPGELIIHALSHKRVSGWRARHTGKVWPAHRRVTYGYWTYSLMPEDTVYNLVFVIKDGAFTPVPTSGHWLSLGTSNKPPQTLLLSTQHWREDSISELYRWIMNTEWET